MTTTYLQRTAALETEGRPPSPVPVPAEVTVLPGPALLAGLGRGPSLAAHREQYGELPALSRAALVAELRGVGLRGRGGAGFPFLRKLESLAPGRPVLVVNLAEGEPASSKDSALALTRPHLVLDGVAVAARALAAREVHVVLPGERPLVATAMRAAIAERTDPVGVTTHTAERRFVAGQAQAVVELLAGRPNLPRTGWVPQSVSGHRGRPTLLSNAETWARVGLLAHLGGRRYAALGTSAEPGTTLLTVGAPRAVPVVREAAYGDRLRDHLPAERWGGAVLVGGFHGSWATWETVASARVSVEGMRALGAPLGAGVLLSAGDACPLALTRDVVRYLAGQSARRCGPCFNGLPALAEAVDGVVAGRGGTTRVEALGRLVARRGACAHPDGTVRLVRSALAVFAAEVAIHADGGCRWGQDDRGWSEEVAG